MQIVCNPFSQQLNYFQIGHHKSEKVVVFFVPTLILFITIYCYYKFHANRTINNRFNSFTKRIKLQTLKKRYISKKCSLSKTETGTFKEPVGSVKTENYNFLSQTYGSFRKLKILHYKSLIDYQPLYRHLFMFQMVTKK